MKMSQTRLFQFYLDNFFKFPTEIKNDIIYCQRALKAHIKVHQMVLDVFQQQEDADPDQKKRILEELESEIYEINAEQHFLFLRLRRVIDEFYKMLKKNQIPMDLNATNAFISKEVVASVGDESIELQPVTVLFRHTEEKLIQKYFEVEKPKAAAVQKPPEEVVEVVPVVPKEPKSVYEIIDSDDEGRLVIAEKPPRKQELKQMVKLDLTNESALSKNGNAIHLSQMSLLKPMAQRLTTTGSGGASADEAAHYLQMDVAEEDDELEEKHNPEVFACTSGFNAVAPQQEIIPTTSSSIVIKTEPLDDLPEFFVSKNVKRSRLNLRQALKKARTEKIAAKAAATATANVRAPPVPSAATKTASPVKLESPPKRVSPPKRASPSPPSAPSSPPPTTETAATAVAVIKKVEFKARASRSGAVAAATTAATVKAVALNSSSEDSNPERAPSPPLQSLWPSEPLDFRTQPDHYGQEMFLRLFDLFTPEMHVQMQQRRSKRKRRTVYSNERADFHYGRIEYGSLPPSNEDNKKKQRKTFLLSPQVKRGLQTKQRRKRASADNKNDEVATPSRSSSSSPDEKRGCNECLKGGGCLDRCASCKGFYHQMCHREEDLIAYAEDNDQKPRSTTSAAAKRASPINNKINLCPACKRAQKKFLKKEKQQYQTLHSTAQELETKMTVEKNRRANLQQASKMYKIQMRNLFNIVNTIKSDQENDDSSE